MSVNPKRRPVVLAEFSIGEIWTAWANYYAGVWYVDFEGVYPLIDSDLSDGFETKEVIQVGSVVVDGVPMVEYSVLSSLEDNEGFYWDQVNKRLYCRFFGSVRPEVVGVKVGFSVFVGTETFVDIDSETTFLPDLIGLPPLERSKDRLFFKKIQTSSFQMILNNGNLTYDGIKDWDVFNQRINYYFGYNDQELSEFQIIKVGQIKDFGYKGDQVIINIIDPRAVFDSFLPNNTYQTTAFTQLDPDDEGLPIPLTFGEVRRTVATILNKEGSEPFICKVADDSVGSIKSIDTVYVDDEVVTPTNVDLDDCTFELSASQLVDGTRFKKVTVDLKGYVDSSDNLISNPLDIITFILSTFFKINYNNTNYNTSEWEEEKIGKPDIGFCVDRRISVKKIIETISISLKGGFLVELDGRYTFRSLNRQSIYDMIIYDGDWEGTPDVSVDTDEILSFSVVNYSKNVDTKRYKSNTNKDFEKLVNDSFNIYESESFDTYLVDESDAIDLNDEIMDLSKDETIIIEGKLPLSFAFNNIGKLFKADINRFIDGEYVEWYGTLTGEILKVSPDINDETVTVQLRVIPDVGREVGESGAVYGTAIYGISNYGG